MQRVALTGVTGHLGAAVLRELVARGYQVKALVRNVNVPGCSGIPIELVKGDILDRDALAHFLSGCDVLIHSAAAISINGDPDGMVTRTNVEGTRNVLETARAAGIRRAVYVGSIHVYQQLPKELPLDEERILIGREGSAYDRSKRDGLLLALSMNQPDFEVIAVHPTALIGPYDFKPSRAGKAIIDFLKGRMPFVVPGGFDFSDSRDAANATVNALTMGRGGEAYLLPGTWYSMQQFVSLLSQVSAKRIRVLTMPMFLAKAGLPFMHVWSRLRKEEPIYTREALETVMYGNMYIRGDKAKRDLNYSPRPLEETLKDTWKWFLENGYLGK